MIELIVAIIITEALVELLTKSEFFKPFRRYFFKRRQNALFNFIHELLDCGYCTSVWIGFLTSIILVNYKLFNPTIDWFVFWILTHRMSNVLHNVIDRIKGDLFQ